jgi:DNA-binding response OmpR family regulator
MHLLIVEDNAELASLLQKGLVAEHHVVDVVDRGEEGLDRAESGVYDAVILDLMLPDMNGIEVTRRLRSEGSDVPVVMLTARDSLADRLSGFDVGADDYVTKPFAFQELLARLRAVTRRGKEVKNDGRLAVGDLVLDRLAHEVTRAGKPIHLTHKEYAVLEFLMEHAGQVLSRTLILERVWDYAFTSFANVVDVTIARLRRAIDDEFDPPLIQTVRGIGYKMVVPPR